MPTRMDVATLPFPTAAAACSTRSHTACVRGGHPSPATILRFPEAAVPAPARAGRVDYEGLVEEACAVARRLGCELRRRWLGGASGGGFRWERGSLRIVLDLESPAAARLAVVADALRGERRLTEVAMSRELAEYLQPRRAA